MPQSPLLTYDMWHFGLSKDKDSDFGEDDSSGVRMQPDHFPNVARPGGGYHKDTIVESDKPPVFCNKCDDEMIDGSCLRCDWGEQNRAVPMPNYPLDPFRDDKAGIRAGSWKFSMPMPAATPEKWRNKYEQEEKFKGWEILSSDKEIEKAMKKMSELGKATGRIKIKAKCPNGHTSSVTLEKPSCSICSEKTRSERMTIPVSEWRDRYKEKFKGWEILNTDKEIKEAMKGLESNQGKAKVWAKCPKGHDSYKNQPLVVTLNDPRCKQCASESKKETSPLIYEPSRQEKIKNINQFLEFKRWEPNWDELEWNKDARGHKSFNASKLPIQHSCDQNAKLNISINTILDWIKRDVDGNLTIPCPNEECEDYGELQHTYNPNKPGQLYIFEYGGTIVIGITNSWSYREQEYGNPHRKKIEGPRTRRHYVPDAIDFSQTDVQFHSPEDGSLNVPSFEELESRGLAPLNQESTPETGLVTMPMNLRWNTEERKKELFDPKNKRLFERARRRKKQKEGSKPYVDIPENAHVFGPMNGYIPQNIENAIMQWWNSLNISPRLDAQTYTETISANPSEATVNGMDLGPDLTLDLHVFLIQQMIENGGHMDKLSEVLTSEDQQTLSAFFDNNPDKKNSALGVTWDPEQGKYVHGNDFGKAFGIDETYIPASNWSFEESVEKPTEEQVQNIQTQRAMQLSEDQQKALQAPQLSPNFYGNQRFQEELAKHPEWAETAIPETQIPQDLRSVPRGDSGNFEGIHVNQPYRDPINGDVRMIDENNQQWIAYNGQWVRVAKIQDFWTGF